MAHSLEDGSHLKGSPRSRLSCTSVEEMRLFNRTAVRQKCMSEISGPFLTDLDSRAAVKGSRDPLGAQAGMDAIRTTRCWKPHNGYYFGARLHDASARLLLGGARVSGAWARFRTCDVLEVGTARSLLEG